MTESKLTLPLKCAVASLFCLSAGLIHASSNPTLVSRQLGSEMVRNSLTRSGAKSACDQDGFALDEGPANCVDYYWYDELRYRVVRDENIRIFSMSQSKHPHLIGAVTQDGIAEVSRGGAKPTFEFMLEMMLGVVSSRETAI
jgi:hypothetical protein